MSSTPRIQVRPATLDDVDDVARIHVRSWQHAYRGQLPDAVLDALDVAQRAALWRADVGAAASTLLLAVLDARTIGFCSLAPSRDPDAAPGTAEVVAIYVDPDHYGAGAGTALLTTALAEARRRRDHALTLWVLDTNQLARRFYERCGLRWDGTSKNVQRPGYTLTELRYRIELGVAPEG